MIRRLIPLPTGAARCPSTRTVPCSQADTCARGLAPHGPGREVRDFSTEARMPGGGCVWHVTQQYAEPASQQPTVHDAPGWMR